MAPRDVDSGGAAGGASVFFGFTPARFGHPKKTPAPAATPGAAGVAGAAGAGAGIDIARHHAVKL